MIDYEKTKAWRSDPVRHTYTERDTILYALGVGFAADPLAGWLGAAGFQSARYVPLPVDPAATGPALFTATAVAMPPTSFQYAA